MSADAISALVPLVLGGDFITLLLQRRSGWHWLGGAAFSSAICFTFAFT
jgi:hypothetical protein